jgi:hypothetical protein
MREMVQGASNIVLKLRLKVIGVIHATVLREVELMLRWEVTHTRCAKTMSGLTHPCSTN